MPPAGGISNFVVYYGPDRSCDLARFDLAILSPLRGGRSVEWLNEQGVLTIGYLSLTTVGDWEPWADDVEPGWVVGELVEWEEPIINACEPGWWDIVLGEAIPFLIDKGFRGLFLDNLDVVEDFPWMAEALVGLIKAIRDRWPNLFLIQNRGFVLLNETAPYLDAVVFEDFGTYYNFTTGRYEKLRGRGLLELERIADRLVELRSSYGLIVLALAYADPSDPDMMEDYMGFVSSLAKRYGFIPYVSDVNLTYINMAYARPERVGPWVPWGPVALVLLALASISIPSAWLISRRAEGARAR